MKLEILLWFMAHRMASLAKSNFEFASRLKDRDCVLQIQTIDGAIVRHFHFTAGRVLSQAEAHDRPDLCIRFLSVESACHVLTCADKQIFVQGIQDKAIRVEGQYILLMWFAGLARFMRLGRSSQGCRKAGPPSIHFYFDFISPFGYIAAMKIEALAARYGRQVHWHSMLLGVSVLKTMGLKPLAQTPLKGPYSAVDIYRLAALYQVPLNFPENGIAAPLPPARAFYWVRQQSSALAGEFARRVYRAHWDDGRDIADPALLACIATDLGLNGEALKRGIASDDIKQLLHREIESSLKLGVFGSPTFAVDGELIWGSDRLWMLEHWLQHGRWDMPTAVI